MDEPPDDQLLACLMCVSDIYEDCSVIIIRAWVRAQVNRLRGKRKRRKRNIKRKRRDRIAGTNAQAPSSIDPPARRRKKIKKIRNTRSTRNIRNAQGKRVLIEAEVEIKSKRSENLLPKKSNQDLPLPAPKIRNSMRKEKGK